MEIVDKNYEYITSCPHCGFPADVDMSIVLTSHPHNTEFGANKSRVERASRYLQMKS